MTDLRTAVSLAAVIEGLRLFAFPDAWRRAAEWLAAMPPMRALDMGVIAAGSHGPYAMRG